MARAGADRRKRWWRRGVATLLGIVVLMVAINLHVIASVADRIVAPELARISDALIVPGARIGADGQPYDVLRDRLDAALVLWQRGAAPRIVLSGRGDGDLATDEVASMRRYLEAAGVPKAALVDDALGLRTLDTMDRAATVFGVRRAIVVTNEFHLARAVFLAERRGLDVIGIVAPERVRLTLRTRMRNALREPLARIAAWLDVFVWGTRGQGCG